MLPLYQRFRKVERPSIDLIVDENERIINEINERNIEQLENSILIL